MPAPQLPIAHRAAPMRRFPTCADTAPNRARMSNRSKMFVIIFAAAVFTAWASASSASIITFDNFKGTGASGYTEETRTATATFGTVLNSLNTVAVTEIQFRWNPRNEMDVTFGIFDSELGGSYGSLNWSPIGNNLLYSQTQHVSAVAGPVGYNVVFTGFNFTFLANHRYDIGLVGSTGQLTGSWDIQNGAGNINTVMGGFESINRNANLSRTPFRSNVGYASVDPHIRLLVPDATPVPEPATLSLLGVGLAGAAVRRFRKRK